MNDHHHAHDPELALTLDRILRTLNTLKGQVNRMSQNIDNIRQDLVDTQTDLAEIKANVATALESIPGLQQTIADQKAQIESLTAGDVLTEQQLTDLKASADATRDQAEAVAAGLRPPTPPAEPPVV